MFLEKNEETEKSAMGGPQLAETRGTAVVVLGVSTLRSLSEDSARLSGTSLGVSAVAEGGKR